MPTVEIPGLWTAQPTFGVELNLNSTLTQQAICAYSYFSGNKNLATGGTNAGLSATNWTATGTPDIPFAAGGGINNLNAIGGKYNATNYRQIQIKLPVSSWSIGVVWAPTAAVSSSTTICGVCQAAGNSTFDRQIRIQSPGFHSTSYLFDGAQKETATNSGTIVQAPILVVQRLLACSGGSDGVNLFHNQDGMGEAVPVAVSNSGFTGYSGNPFFNIGDSSNSVASVAVALCIFVGRCWTMQERMSFGRNPFQILAPYERRLYTEPGAAGPAIYVPPRKITSFVDRQVFKKVA